MRDVRKSVVVSRKWAVEVRAGRGGGRVIVERKDVSHGSVGLRL